MFGWYPWKEQEGKGKGVDLGEKGDEAITRRSGLRRNFSWHIMQERRINMKHFKNKICSVCGIQKNIQTRIKGKL